MIFDDICRNIDFEIFRVNGDLNAVASSNKFHLALMLEKGKISFMDLMRGYEDDSKNVTMSFTDKNGETYVNIIFYDDGDDILEVILKSKDGNFNSLLSAYCGN